MSRGAAGSARAHPLGIFSVNYLTVVSVSADCVDLRYVLDQAEIPTFQKRGIPPAKVLARKRSELLCSLVLTDDGLESTSNRDPRRRSSFPARPGGVPVTRVVLPLWAPVRMPARITLRGGQSLADQINRAVIAVVLVQDLGHPGRFDLWPRLNQPAQHAFERIEHRARRRPHHGGSDASTSLRTLLHPSPNRHAISRCERPSAAIALT